MLTADIVITTKNRHSELREALSSALMQVSVSKIIVIDDGSEDQTYEMVSSEFPSVIIHRNPTSLGLICSRNIAAHLSTSDVIFSIDDDAVFSCPNTVTNILDYFFDDTVAVVSIPYREPNKANISLQAPPSTEGLWASSSFVGTAHALKRSLFLQLGAYDEFLFRQGEEGDFAIRCIDAGYKVVLGRSAEILHFESPNRNSHHMAYYGPRNTLYFVYKYAPWRLLFFHLSYCLAKLLAYSLKIPATYRLSYLRGILAGTLVFIDISFGRSSVSPQAYSSFLRLRRHPVLINS